MKVSSAPSPHSRPLTVQRTLTLYFVLGTRCSSFVSQKLLIMLLHLSCYRSKWGKKHALKCQIYTQQFDDYYC